MELNKIVALIVGFLLIGLLVPIGLEAMATADLDGTPAPYDSNLLAGTNYTFNVTYLTYLPLDDTIWDITIHTTEVIESPKEYHVNVTIDDGFINLTGNWTGATTIQDEEYFHLYMPDNTGMVAGPVCIFINISDENWTVENSVVVMGEIVDESWDEGAVDATVQIIVLVMVPLFAVLALALIYVREIR